MSIVLYTYTCIFFPCFNAARSTLSTQNKYRLNLKCPHIGWHRLTNKHARTRLYDFYDLSQSLSGYRSWATSENYVPLSRIYAWNFTRARCRVNRPRGCRRPEKYYRRYHAVSRDPFPVFACAPHGFLLIHRPLSCSPAFFFFTDLIRE